MKKLLLLVSMLGISGLSSAQALNEGFEGTTFPPTGWSVVDTNATSNWELTSNSLTGNGAATVLWYNPTTGVAAGDQDESLISPTFSLVGYTSAYLNFNVTLGYEYMVDPNNYGDFTVDISSNGGTSWTTLYAEDNEFYDDYDLQELHIDLTAYLGQSSLKIRFHYVGNDADTVVLDDVSVTSCATADSFALTALTDTTLTLGWAGTSSTYDVEYGAPGFTLGTGTLSSQTTPTLALTGLTAGAGYSIYIRANCGSGSTGTWQGPFTVYTTLSTSTSPNYAYGFDGDAPLYAVGWDNTVVTNATGGSWGKYTGTGTLVQDGTGLAACFAATASTGTGPATNAWLFSRGLNLVAGAQYTVNYYYRKYIATGGTTTGGTNTFTAKIGTAKTAAGQTTTLGTHIGITNTTYTLKTATYTPATTGVYYIGFNCTSPGQTATNNGAVLVDAVSVTAPLSVGDELANSFNVYPNPVDDIFTVFNTGNIEVKGMTLADLNGRVVVRSQKSHVESFDVNIAELASGMYIVNLETAKGVVTKKIVKN